MTQANGKLPQQFIDLEAWLPWALATEAERNARRTRSSLADLSAFCDALKPRMHDLIQYMAKFEWGTALAEADENLYRLGLSYMEATIPLDLGWKSTVAEDSFPVERLNLDGRL